MEIGSRGWGMFAYWATVASVGNFLDYVPVRTFTTEGDMKFDPTGLGLFAMVDSGCSGNSNFAGSRASGGASVGGVRCNSSAS
jgi:hypothetical protein